MPPSNAPDSPNGRATGPRGFRHDKTVRMATADLYKAIRKQQRKEALYALVVVASLLGAMYVVVKWL